MNKEQFLAMNFPHELKVMIRGEIFEWDYLMPPSIYRSTQRVTPICHPLSDLTKDEWIDKLNTFACELLDAAHVYDEKNIIGLNWMTQPFEIVMWLVKNHFNLMDESEPFIDVNTLPENPYK